MNYVGSKVRFVETGNDYIKHIYGKVIETDDGKYEGVVGYCPTNCEITTLCVSEAFRKQGLGTQLFWKAVSMMPQCSEITLRAYRSHEYSSVRFYQKQGMTLSENDPLLLHYHDPDARNTVLMVLKNRN